VLSAITTFFACLRRLFGMWLYVVYVCACLMYLSVGCLVVSLCVYVPDVLVCGMFGCESMCVRA
jgi:hypothetical protein